MPTAPPRPQCAAPHAPHAGLQTDLQIKCDAISSSVLDSDFAASHFRMGTRNYLDAVRNMCATCEAQAPTDKARKELEKTCAKWEATQ